MTERTGVVTWNGPVTLVGPEIRVGDTAPDVALQGTDRAMINLSNWRGKVRVLNVVPSLDTGICDAQTRKFNQEVSNVNPDAVVLTVSADLPFAQKRWCGGEGLEHVITLSDHLAMAFGSAYGTYMKEHRLECRAVFVVDSTDNVTYAEYCPTIAQHPNYEAALAVVKAAK